MHNIHHTHTHIHLYISEPMDNQVDSETLNKLLENDMISLSGGKSDTDLRETDPDANSQEDVCTTETFLNIS